MNVINLSTIRLAAALRAREVSAIEVLQAHLSEIDARNPVLNAVVTLDADRAILRAREADAALARGELWGPLHGVPFTLKDAHATVVMRTTTGFPPIDHVPPFDGTVAARLKAAGGILMGKTNVATMLGDPGQTANPIFGRTNNPWNVERTPGGSSGGAAAAVAAHLTPFDVGTDLAGSIRIPAHFCGVCGLKPTEHRVSLYGLIPGLPPPPAVRIMSCIGPLARTVDDIALIYHIIAGPDGIDTDVPPVPIDDVPRFDLKNAHIAFAPSFAGLPVAAEIRAALESLAGELRSAGAIVEEAALPMLDFQQALANAGEIVGMLTSAFGPEAQTQPTTLAQYLIALGKRDQSINAWEQFFAQWDALICPPAMCTAFPHTETGAPLYVDGQEQIYWMVNAHTMPFNYSGHPAIVLPIERDHDGLPIGAQMVGRRWGEARLLAMAKAVEEMRGAKE